jgi:hypothetical protein
MIKRGLTDIDIRHYVKKLKIPHFRGVFMRDTLPSKPRQNECAIVNLDLNKNRGTHWVAYAKKGDQVTYFDSYGNLRPPKELIKYFTSVGHVLIRYNHTIYQRGSYICGQLCLEFLYNQYN